ncbi:MAG TPA: hypothetical protein VFS00_10095 [Polyangiaceae bacterium]|nr:hypothetical protein [Polyangiaceae bacterium]
MTAKPLGRSSSDCRLHLPKVRSPTSFAPRPSRSAAATSSAPEAVARSTSTADGTPCKRGEPCARTSSPAPPRRCSDTIGVPGGKSSPATATASSNEPPGLPRRSSTTPCTGSRPSSSSTRRIVAGVRSLK